MPRTILVEFSDFYEKKDSILAGLWERFGVDSLQGDWDYVEPLLFGPACGIVIDTRSLDGSLGRGDVGRRDFPRELGASERSRRADE